MVWSDYLVLVFAILIVINVLLQQSRDDLRDVFSGDTELFKNKKIRGLDLILNITMLIFAVLFFVFLIVSRVLIS